jgi:hypothetical protein
VTFEQEQPDHRPHFRVHIRMLLGQMDPGDADVDMLAIQLTAALDAPLLLYLSASDLAARPAGCRTDRAQLAVPHREHMPALTGKPQARAATMRSG